MIPVCEPLLLGSEKEYVADCLDSNWISSQGKYIEGFERKFAAYCDCKYGIATTNGTTALHLALVTLGIGKGDEVIIPTFTMAASAFAVVYTGAKPVFVDCTPDTWTIDVNRIEEAITKRTRAIMPVHIYGHPCEMDPIWDLAREYNLLIIEDAAEAHGAEYRKKRCGSLGNIGCFSFYANKIITCGEGGMIVTNNRELAEKARSLKDLCHSRKKRFLHTDIGFNYRMTNLQAAIGLAQLENIDYYVARRRRHAHLYIKHLTDVPGITLPVEKAWAKNVYWMFGILVSGNRNGIMQELQGKDIQTRPFFVPMHQQPMFIGSGEDCLVAEKIGQEGFYLPSGSGLRAEQIKYICETLKEVLR